MTAFTVLIEKQSDRIVFRGLLAADKPTSEEIEVRDAVFHYTADLCHAVAQEPIGEAEKVLHGKAREVFVKMINHAIAYKKQHGKYPDGEIDLSE